MKYAPDSQTQDLFIISISLREAFRRAYLSHFLADNPPQRKLKNQLKTIFILIGYEECTALQPTPKRTPALFSIKKSFPSFSKGR